MAEYKYFKPTFVHCQSSDEVQKLETILTEIEEKIPLRIEGKMTITLGKFQLEKLPIEVEKRFGVVYLSLANAGPIDDAVFLALDPVNCPKTMEVINFGEHLEYEAHHFRVGNQECALRGRFLTRV